MHRLLLPAGCSTASRRPSWCSSYQAPAICPSPSCAACSSASLRRTATSGGSWTCSSSSAAQVLLRLMHVHATLTWTQSISPRPARSAARRGHWLERAGRAGVVGVHGSPAAGLHLLHLLHHGAAQHQGHPPARACLGHSRHLCRCAACMQCESNQAAGMHGR